MGRSFSLLCDTDSQGIGFLVYVVHFEQNAAIAKIWSTVPIFI